MGRDDGMDLNLEPPPPLTLTLTPQPIVPPDIPPDPSISMLFPENTPYRVLNNPFRGPNPKKLSETHKTALQDALGSVRSPFLFNLVEPYTFNGECVGDDTPSDSFNSAVNTVIAAVERGYCLNRDPAPLDPSDWARLSSALLAAVGRGYHRQYTPDQEAALERVRAGATDPNPLLGTYPTFFHRLGATAEQVAFHLEADTSEGLDGYQDWYCILKTDFNRKATKAAAAEVDEKWLTWKANQLDRLVEAHQSEVAAKARERGINYFIETADRLGLQVTQSRGSTNPFPTPSVGKKRTVSGSAPKPVPPTPAPAQATRVNPPRAAKQTTSVSPAPRGRETALAPQPAARADPSPSPRRGRKTPTQSNTLPTRLDEDRPMEIQSFRPPTRAAPTSDQPDPVALTATVLTKILARLEALEKRSMPPTNGTPGRTE